MAHWPTVTAHLQYTFSARHALPGVEGGGAEPHEHRYIARFGFRHEVPPTTGLAGSHALADWDRSAQNALAAVRDADLNALCAPYPPTSEVLACRLLSLLPAYFEFVELAAYQPLYTVRVERKGMRLEWPA